MSEEMFISNIAVDPINTYFVVLTNISLVSTLTKVIKKRRKTILKKNLDTLKGAHSDTTTSSRLLSTTIHSVSQTIICDHTDKISMYNKSDIGCCAESGASKYMFPDYSTFKTFPFIQLLRYTRRYNQASH